MIEKPGSLASATFLVSFFAGLLTLPPRFLAGGVMLMEPYPEEAGLGVYIGGLKPEDCD
jgi:hypothetical protein